jgi:hypothetical protein
MSFGETRESRLSQGSHSNSRLVQPDFDCFLSRLWQAEASVAARLFLCRNITAQVSMDQL